MTILSATSCLSRRQWCAGLVTLLGGLAAGACATVSPQAERSIGRKEEVLERETARSALLLRRILGPIRLTPVTPSRAAVLPSRNRPAGPGTDPGPGGRFDFIKMVEAVGIEPTSGNPRQQASTSLAGYLLRLASRPPNRPGHRSASSCRSRPAPRSRVWSQSPEYDALTRTLVTQSGGRWRVLGRQS